MKEKLIDSLLRLIIKTSTSLTPDVEEALYKATLKEELGTSSNLALNTAYQNAKDAREVTLPICQDTGMPTFFIKTPVGFDQLLLKECIHIAISKATELGKLRPNSVDPLSGKNTGNNLGPETPIIHFEQWRSNDIEIKLILKGGGCENKNIQYALPTELEGLGMAGRDLDGVRKCILHSIFQAQGQGCSAGFIGIGIGGDRTSGYECAKKQLFRKVDDQNYNEDLARLESYILENANKLDIGMMGFGGRSTLLGCKIGVVNRIAPSFFVSVAYNCWAFRRRGVLIDIDSLEIKDWYYEKDTYESPDLKQEEVEHNVYVLQTPLKDEDILKLKVGDIITINGEIFTGRDSLHKYLMDNESPVDLNGGVIYHCGPVMKKENDTWKVLAAGPTTSIREEPYQATVIKKFGIKMVIGKGGMGNKTLDALKENKCIYVNAIGGAAQFYANKITKVCGVHFLDEFGIPEALWHLETQGFMGIVTMDAYGGSLHEGIKTKSLKNLSDFADKIF